MTIVDVESSAVIEATEDSMVAISQETIGYELCVELRRVLVQLSKVKATAATAPAVQKWLNRVRELFRIGVAQLALPTEVADDMIGYTSGGIPYILVISCGEIFVSVQCTEIDFTR